MPDVKTLYDEDFVAWSQQQAEALRAAGHGGTNQRLDWENLAEEIESLGRSEKREVRSRISTIIEHLIKLSHSPAVGPRHDWRHTINRERLEIERLLDDSPSLRRDVPDMVASEAGGAVKLALEAMDARGELSAALEQTKKTKTYRDFFAFTPEQILGDWFPPEHAP